MINTLNQREDIALVVAEGIEPTATVVRNDHDFTTMSILDRAARAFLDVYRVIRPFNCGLLSRVCCLPAGVMVLSEVVAS